MRRQLRDRHNRDARATLDRIFERCPDPEAKHFAATEARPGLMRASARPARASTSSAHAAYLAADRGWPVVSARPGPIRAMHPEVEIEPLP